MANRAIDIPQRYYVEDSLFPTDNMLEIPQLRLDMQPKSCAIPFVLFGEQRRSFQMKGQGTLCFYTDDYRFNAVYEHPERILYMQPKNIVEPNFSLYDETPIAFGMQQIYKKRWIDSKKGWGTISGIITKSSGYVAVKYDSGSTGKAMAFNLTGEDGNPLKKRPK